MLRLHVSTLFNSTLHYHPYQILNLSLQHSLDAPIFILTLSDLSHFLVALLITANEFLGLI